MGAIKVHEFITLDGVIDNPTWTMEFGFDPKMGESIGALTADSSAILLGRKTYEMFAPAWSTRAAEDDLGAPFLNDTAKYVVTSTLTATDWSNSSVVGPYDPATIRKLKGDVPDTIYVSGSATLVRAMLADGLVDELHLFVYPVTLGGGLRLFPGRHGGAEAVADRVGGLRQRGRAPGLRPALLRRGQTRAHALRVRTIDDLLAEARARLSRLTPAEALAAQNSGALLVDTRSERDRSAEGVLPGALVVERTVLEWRLDPKSPTRLPEASYDAHVVVVCNDGYSSSLAAATLQDIGISRATDMIGGFRAWRLGGLPVNDGVTGR